MAPDLVLDWMYVAITQIKQLMVVQGYLLPILLQFILYKPRYH